MATQQQFPEDVAPNLPIIKPRTQQELLLSKLTKETEQDALTLRQLKSYTPYEPSGVKQFLFESGITDAEALCEGFKTKYKPHNTKQFQSKEVSMKLVKCGKNKFYFGELNSEHKCHGFGVVIFNDGRLYEGEFNHNMRNGQGLYVQKDLSWYFGGFLNDLREGFGIEVHKQYTYQGMYRQGQKNGTGILVANHMNYNGEWRLNIMHGSGYLETEQSKYEGGFQNFRKHGMGYEVFRNGDQYRGMYFNGKPDGDGEYKWAKQKCKFKGIFQNGERSGKGIWENGKGDKYVGNYRADVKSGYGQFYWRSGNFYKGNFLDDLREGYGEMFWSDGSVYKGQWHRGVQHGKGQLYVPGQDPLTGIFQNNILVSHITSPQQKIKNLSLIELGSLPDKKYAKNHLRPSNGNINRRKLFSSNMNISQQHSPLGIVTERPKGMTQMRKPNFYKNLNNHKSKTKSKSKSPDFDKLHSPTPGHHRFCKACASKSGEFRISTRLPMTNLVRKKQQAEINSFMNTHYLRK